jgi:YfiH family protein
MANSHPVKAPNLEEFDWLEHGFGLMDSVPPPHVRTVKQIHSALVGDAEDQAFVEGDALLSKGCKLPVGIKTADCVPILLADPETRSVAAIHAGWRGTVENIAARAVRELGQRWGVDPAKIHAAIGPSIGVCCYEVGPDVARRFGQWIPEMSSAEGPAHLDLRAVNLLQLRVAGVQNLWSSAECTFCAADRFHSFRRQKEQAGRMLSFIGPPSAGSSSIELQRP